MVLESATHFEEQQFKGLEQQGTIIQSKEFYTCTFRGCKFNETVFQDCVFIECVFEECDLSLVRIPNVTFQETRFIKTKLVGINWTEANWTEQGLLKRKTIGFRACILDYSTFMGLNLEDVEMVECSAKQVAFEEVDLAGANCTKTDFESSRFIRANLSKANFTDAVNYDINAQFNTLHKTKFSFPEAVSLLRSLDIILVE